VSGPVHLVDASYFIFRAYHSMPPDMVDGDGNATHALYGFARFLCDVLERERPTHIAVAFDHGGNSDISFRRGLYPLYKANREAPPLDLRRQIGLCREFCRHLGVAELASELYEADDIIGTLAARSRAAGLANVVLTRDKDLAQVIRGADVFWDYTGGSRYRYTDIHVRFGAQPELMPDYLALTGDAVDNIPGVPGVGPKTAAALCASFGALEALYADLRAVSASALRGAAGIAARLEAHRDGAFLARRLTGIVCDLKLEVATDDLRRRPPDAAALENFFNAQGFGSILRQQARRLTLA
jgi:5'-3' exonuclease